MPRGLCTAYSYKGCPSGASGARRSNYPISRPINLRTPAPPNHRHLGILNLRPPQLTIYTR